MENWEKDLQQHNLQKAINCELGFSVSMDEFLEKATPIGTIRAWQGGRRFIKTEGGWKPISKKRETKEIETSKTSDKTVTSEDMIRDIETKRRMSDLGLNNEEIKRWVEKNHSKTKNYIPNTYYRAEGGSGEGSAGVGNGLYLGRDEQAILNFYAWDSKEDKASIYHGTPKWLDLMDYSKYDAFESDLKKKGIEMMNSNKVGDIVKKMGYDGIRYYDPTATGEEFVLFNTERLKKIR